jgi:hypothetical protein
MIDQRDDPSDPEANLTLSEGVTITHDDAPDDSPNIDSGLGEWPAKHSYVPNCEYLKTDRGCFWCCPTCDIDRHTCPGCGDPLTHLDNNMDKTPHTGCTD